MTDRPAPFALTDEERATPLWLKLRAHFETRIERLRAQNDDPALTPEQTAAIRGQIAAFRALVKLNAPRPAPDLG